ncbi:MAG: DUF5654 family protein [Candidatus Micrarchaeota archaeon]|nr:DUF5654 family protein [Candidatus Micrarchaeota archaeon]
MELSAATRSDLKEEIKENKQEIRKLKEQAILADKEKEVANQFIIVISTALGVVSALFWQKAINTTLVTFVPVSGWNYELAIAFLITLISTMIIVTLHQKQ